MARITVLYRPDHGGGTPRSLLDFLRENNLPVTADCGGNGKCGKCLVTVKTGDRTEKVPACQTYLTQPCEIILPEAVKASPQYIPDNTAGITDIVPGLAVDLGTTTIAVSLFDLNSGKLFGTFTERNAQASYGADVISRTDYIIKHKNGLGILSEMARRQIMEMYLKIAASSGITGGDPKALAIAGNTIMQHIYALQDPSGIATAPYTPKTRFDDPSAFPSGEKLAPCISGYVGGDIVAGIYASGLMHKDEHSLFIDIGTNGEMAVGGKDKLICCSVATGPAFEGAQITCGMTAADGAISHFSWEDGKLQMQLFSDKAAKGICGSGLIDLLAVLLRLEIIDESGWLMPPEEVFYLPEDLRGKLDEDEDGNGILYLTDDHTIRFTAKDVRALQLAKAAVAAGIEMLLSEAGLTADKIDRLYIAGNFGSHLDAANAAAIGMFPDVLKDRIICLGNSSLKGAQALLLKPEAFDEMLKIRDKCSYIELSGSAEFTERYIDHMTFEEQEGI